MLKSIVYASQFLANLAVIAAALYIIPIFSMIDNYFALQAVKELENYPLVRRIEHQGHSMDSDLILSPRSDKSIFRINDLEIIIKHQNKKIVVETKKDGDLWRIESDDLTEYFKSFKLFKDPGLKTVGCVVKVKTNLGFLNKVEHEYKLEIEIKGLSYEIKSFTY